MKTPEEMAEEHANNSGELEDTYVWRADRDGFLAGYQAAKELYAAKLKEANDTVAGMVDECEGLKTIIYDHDETNLPTSAKWISVKERLPEFDKDGYTDDVLLRRYDGAIFLRWFKKRNDLVTGWGIYMLDQITHWMPLPEPPKEEK